MMKMTIEEHNIIMKKMENQFFAEVKADMIEYLKEHPETTPVKLGAMITDFMQERVEKQHELFRMFFSGTNESKKLIQDFGDLVYLEIRGENLVEQHQKLRGEK